MQRILLIPCVFLYKLFKYFVIGVLYFIYFIGYCLVTPFALTIKLIKYINKKTEPSRLKKKKIKAEIKKEKAKLLRIKEARQIRLNEKKYIKQQEEKQKRISLLETKQKEKEESLKLKREKRKKDNDSYINKDVKLEKNSTEAINNLFKKIHNIPENIKNKIKNNKFAKNIRNKKEIKREALLINFEGEDAEKSEVKRIYKYEAKSPEGKTVKGKFEAFSKVEVHSFLLSEGYEVYKITTNKWINFFNKSNTNKTKISNKDLIFFIAQLSTYIKAGIPLVEALKILSRQFEKKKKYRVIFKSIIYDLTMGENFSEALLKQNNAFPKLLINMIKTAEMTGELPEVLDDMYVYYTEVEKTRKQMITAMMYPTLVFVFATGVIVFIMIYVVPQFVEIYESMDASKIPPFTKIVINVSEFLKHYIIWLLLGIGLFIVLFVVLYKKVRLFRTIVQWLIMHFPVFGNTVIYNEVTMFTKTFGSLLAHNVFITESMDVLNKITNNEIYKMLILDTITNLAKGEKISSAFENHWAFPLPAYEMLITGERTGELADMMNKVSEYYQELHKEQVTRIKTFIEPMLTIFLTVIVGIIILAIVLPMFGMYETIQSY